MPIPVSRTSKRTATAPSPDSARVTRRTTSPLSVNLTALPTRLVRTCRSRPGSPRSALGTSWRMRQSSSSPLAWAASAKDPRTSRTARRRSKSTISRSTRPASIFEKSRMSLMISSRARPEWSITSAYSRCSGVRLVSRRRRVMPMTPFMGVRISWLMLATNSDLRREASRAACRARTRRSMLWTASTTPATPPWASRQGWTVQRRKTRVPSSRSSASSGSLTSSPRSARSKTSR